MRHEFMTCESPSFKVPVFFHFIAVYVLLFVDYAHSMLLYFTLHRLIACNTSGQSSGFLVLKPFFALLLWSTGSRSRLRSP